MHLLGRYRGFRALWVGQLASQTGNAVFYIMGLWLIQLKSPFLLSVAGLAVMVPGLMGIIGGSLVDRHDPRRLMLWTDVLRGVAVGAGLLALILPGALIPDIIVLLGINSLGSSLFSPAESVVIPWLVHDDDLGAANGLYALTNQLASAFGSALGGAAIAAVGVVVVFAADLGSFWASAVAILLMMRVVTRPAGAAAPAPSDSPAAPGLLLSLSEGWRGLRELPWLVGLFPVILATNFSFNAAFTMLAFWTRSALHGTAWQFGALEAAWALGMIGGSLAVGLFHRFPMNRVIAWLALLLTASAVGFALSPWAVLAAAALVVGGAANGVVNALLFTVMQRAIPEAIRGRAFGLFTSLLSVVTPLGALAAGVTLNVLPLWWTWGLAAGATLVLAVLAWRTIPEVLGKLGRSGSPAEVSAG